MRQIKFRGRHVEYHDEIYYGFYEMDARGNHFIIDSNNIMHIVDPESVAQLIAVDINGRDVYEGDMVKRIDELDSDEFLTATFEDYSEIINGQIILAEAHHDD